MSACSVCDGQRGALCEATGLPNLWEERARSPCWPSVLGTDRPNSLQGVSSVYYRHGADAFVDKQQKWDVTQFRCRKRTSKSLPCFSCYLRTSVLQPRACSLLPPRPLLCLLKAANSHCRRVFSRCCIDTYQSFDPGPPGVCLRGESGLQGRRFRCCLNSLWRSSGERMQPSWPPAASCEPLASASPLRPKKPATRSRHSSRGPAEVVPYQASLMPKGLPCPPPEVMKHDTVGTHTDTHIHR